MGHRALLGAAVMCAVMAAAPIHGASVTATITADNHYALYFGSETTLTLAGRNELGVTGSPGVYNWSLPETFSDLPVGEDDRFIIVHWDDNPDYPAMTQALLAQFVFSDGRVLSTDATHWSFFITPIANLGAYAAAPTAPELEAALVGASWTIAGFSTPNGTDIWATYTPSVMPGIGTDANWISRTSAGDSSYFLTAFRSVPMRDVQSTIPEPATLVLLGFGLAGLAASCCRKQT